MADENDNIDAYDGNYHEQFGRYGCDEYDSNGYEYDDRNGRVAVRTLNVIVSGAANQIV